MSDSIRNLDLVVVTFQCNLEHPGEVSKGNASGMKLLEKQRLLVARLWICIANLLSSCLTADLNLK